MRNHLFILIIMAICLVSCHKVNPSVAMDHAEEALQNGDFDLAREYCLSLNDSTEIMPSQLCRQALVYAQLSERCDNPADLNIALDFLARAMEFPDSVDAFIEKSDVDNRSTLNLLIELKRTLDNPPSATIEPFDSISSTDLLQGYEIVK